MIVLYNYNLPIKPGLSPSQSNIQLKNTQLSQKCCQGSDPLRKSSGGAFIRASSLQAKKKNIFYVFSIYLSFDHCLSILPNFRTDYVYLESMKITFRRVGVYPPRITRIMSIGCQRCEAPKELATHMIISSEKYQIVVHNVTTLNPGI